MLALIGLVASQVASSPEPAISKPIELSQSWSCAPRKTCGKISSCEEAEWYLVNCSWGPRLDRDNDGAPCESLCGSNN